jgi:hypothetical protein
MREEEEDEEEYDAEAAWIQKARSGQFRRGSTERAEQRAQAAQQAAATKERANSYGGWHPSREDEEEDDDEEGGAGARAHHHHHQAARRPAMAADRPMRVPTGYRTKFRSSAEGEPEEERAHTFR